MPPAAAAAAAPCRWPAPPRAAPAATRRRCCRRCGSRGSPSTWTRISAGCQGTDPPLGSEERGEGRRVAYIMTFHVSTGRSASLKDQSNFSSASGSSVGSWYGARYSCASAWPALTRFRGSKTSMSSRSAMAWPRSAWKARAGEKPRRTERVGVLELVGERLPLPLGQRLDEA